jgi:hypothetical protein
VRSRSRQNSVRTLQGENLDAPPGFEPGVEVLQTVYITHLLNVF